MIISTEMEEALKNCWESGDRLEAMINYIIETSTDPLELKHMLYCREALEDRRNDITDSLLTGKKPTFYPILDFNEWKLEQELFGGGS